MKLLIYLHSLEAGGAERVAVNMANHWASRGWEVLIVTVEMVHCDFYELHPAVQRIGLGLTGNSNSVRKALTRNLARLSLLRRIIVEFQPDTALSLMVNANVVLSLASCGLRPFPVVGSEHSYPDKLPSHAIWKWLRRFAYRRMHAVVGLTPECSELILRDTLASRSPTIPNVAACPLPVQMPVIPPDSACRPGRKILLGVGRLSEEKDFTVLIDAFARLVPRHPDWDLVLLGRGPLQAALQQQAERLGLSDRVFLPGIVGNLTQWYSRADLYAMTSRFEGFPNTLAEAMAHGMPAVSYDCDSGPRDIIRHGTDGLLVRPGDIDGLCEALDRVMGDADLRRRFAQRAVDARERFSMEKIAGMWENLFDEGRALAGRGRAVSLHT